MKYLSCQERFIADTLYKKLWIHVYYAMSISDVAFFYASNSLFIVVTVSPPWNTTVLA